MSDREEKLQHMIELILIYDRLRKTTWAVVKEALQERINEIGAELFPPAIKRGE